MTAACIPLLAAITFLVSDIFSAMDHDPVQVELERIYYQILMLGIVVTLAKICLSSYFGYGRSKVVMICDVCGLVLNVPLAYAMVFGHFGFPALGIVGAGISTMVATIFSFLYFWVFSSSGLIVRSLRLSKLFRWRQAFSSGFCGWGFRRVSSCFSMLLPSICSC